MSIRKIAHLSDLHIGQSARHDAAAVALRDAIESRGIDQVIVTGDVTDHGRYAEFELFEALFSPLRAAGRLTVVPGNHDRRGDDVGRKMMDTPRVDAISREGLMIIRINSTAPHNRFLITGHGRLDETVLDETERLISGASPDDVVVAALHHHLLPLPEEFMSEKLSALFRLPFASELKLGHRLLERLRGRCDLLLHGHRHIPKETFFPSEGRDLRMYNAGSSTGSGRFRVFAHDGAKVVGPPEWVTAAPPASRFMGL